MKVFLIETAVKHNKYTYRTLYELMRAFGITLVGAADDADVVLISVDDPDDLPTVRRARRIAGNKPLIAGGFECFCGEYLLAYVDACNVGEGFEFFEALGKARDVRDLFDEPYVLTKGKTTVIPSTRIDEERLPLVRVGPRLWYYLAERGCHNKCAFCLTSFAYPCWSNSKERLRWAVKYVEKRKGKLTLITNDSKAVDDISTTRMTQSVRVTDYLASPERFKGAAMLHFGIEGFSEKQRRFFAKPISDEAVYQLIEFLGAQTKPEAEFFFIAGLPGTFEAMMTFAQKVPLRAAAYPRIFIKLTGLNAMPHTPLWGMPFEGLEFLTDDQIEQFRREIKSRNVGFRLFPVRARARELWRWVVRYCTPEETPLLGLQPNAHMSVDEFLMHLEKNRLMHLLNYDGRPMPNSQIITPWRELRDKMAKARGMPEICYKS